MIDSNDSVDMSVSVDVGKGEHHGVALNRAGKVVFDKALPNDENKVRAVLQQLKQDGIVLEVVDQPATIGALLIIVAQAEKVLVGYWPGLAMRRISDPSRRGSENRRLRCGHHRSSRADSAALVAVDRAGR